MKKIYYIRHAQTVDGARGIMAGSGSNTPLNEVGREQAHKAGQKLKNKGIQLIMVSPMDRTKETAQIIAGEIGLDPSKIVESDLVIERDFGKYSGKPYADYNRDRENGQLDQSELEPLESLQKRVEQAFKWLAERPEQTILVVSHGSTGRMFRVVDRKLARDDFNVMEHFENTEIDEFTL